MTSKYYITTAIDYSNGEPHLGHAYEKIGADCVARYRRLRGHDVHFSIGMDEHGQKVAQAAEEAGQTPQEWVDTIAAKFQAAWDELAISHDDFIRTTEPRHERAVKELFRRVQEGGHITEGVYAGYYCVGCEAFKSEKDLEDGKCPTHPNLEIKWVEEPNYFFEIGRFRQKLLDLYHANPEFVQPRSKYNEVYNVVEGWTDDQKLSVSRARVPWGIPWPDDETHVVYVWFEALINYLSVTGFPDDGYGATWPADVHVIGPDIVRFHAAMWPAMLMAAGIEVPGKVWCHGWVNTGGARFSKSAGVAVTLRNLIDRHGPDALRYFVLREIPWHADGNFTWERFDTRYTSELADGYGNLVSRVLAMLGRYSGGVVPDHPGPTPLDAAGDELIAAYREAMDAHLLHEGAEHAWRLVDRANGFVEERAPWSLAKQGKTAELEETLAALARGVARITLLASPFIPGKAQAVWQALGMPGEVTSATWAALEHPPTSGAQTTKPAPLFPKDRTEAVTN
ncbi:MAG: methionine--tRNA ligase [Gemmatimonadota bacterium]|nr:MAG: methionine--tRNA ligase [Gemmatimonadota bacterium]